MKAVHEKSGVHGLALNSHFLLSYACSLNKSRDRVWLTNMEHHHIGILWELNLLIVFLCSHVYIMLFGSLLIH